MTMSSPANTSEEDDYVEEADCLAGYRKLKLKYGGELSEGSVRHLALALKKVVRNGRYINRTTRSPVCVLARDCDRIESGLDHAVIVFRPVHESEKRMPIEEFIATYSFFAIDCA